MENLFKRNKKGQVGSLQQIAITLLIVGVVLGFTMIFLDDFYDEIDDDDTEAKEAVNDTITAIAKIPNWLGLIVLLLIIGILLSIVFSVLPRGATGGGTV